MRLSEVRGQDGRLLQTGQRQGRGGAQSRGGQVILALHYLQKKNLFQGNMRHPLSVPGPGRAERRVHHLPLGDHLPARQAGDGERHRGDPRDVHHRGGPADRQRH